MKNSLCHAQLQCLLGGLWRHSSVAQRFGLLLGVRCNPNGLGPELAIEIEIEIRIEVWMNMMDMMGN